MASFSFSEMNASIDHLMQSFIESRDEDVITCSCNNTCSTRKCPCKQLKQPCTTSCKCGKMKPCKNGKYDSSSESEDGDDCRPRKRQREQEESGPATPATSTLADQLRRQDQAIQEYVESLSHADLVVVCSDLFRRCPGALSDYILFGRDGENPMLPSCSSLPSSTPTPQSLVQQPEHHPQLPTAPPPSPPPPSPPHAPTRAPSPPAPPHQAVPDWCQCGLCRVMQREIEHKCCRPARGHHCITLSNQFSRLCLDPMVLGVAMRIQEDVLADIPDRSNANYRHQAYRTWNYWQHGRLGPRNRRVVPSCTVWAIRVVFYEPTGVYKGFIEGVGFMND